MFLSSFQGPTEIEAVNIDFISKSLTSNGFAFRKQKNRDLQSGASISSFTIERNSNTMVVFICKLGQNQFICAGYNNGKLIQEKQSKYESDIPSVLQNIFIKIRQNKEEQAIRFDLQIDKIRLTAQRIQQKNKNRVNFIQEVKTTVQYDNYKRIIKKAYQKIISDSNSILAFREKMKNLSKNLIDQLLNVQTAKQELQTSLLQFDEESQFIQNVADRLNEQIDNKKKFAVELTPHNLNEISFKEYLSNLIEVKQLELTKKCLIK